MPGFGLEVQWLRHAGGAEDQEVGTAGEDVVTVGSGDLWFRVDDLVEMADVLAEVVGYLADGGGDGVISDTVCLMFSRTAASLGKGS